MNPYDDLVSVPSEEGDGELCVVDHVDPFEYVKNPTSAFSHKVPEWIQLELEALFKQKNLHPNLLYYEWINHSNCLSLGILEVLV